mgnify:CR=1 FL=1
MTLINKEKLIKRLASSERFNSPLPKWFWMVINSIPDESEEDDAEKEAK